MVAEPSALVLGATGVAGSAVVDELVSRGEPVLAAARRPGEDSRDLVTPVALDLLDREATREALASHSVRDVYYCVHWRDKAPTEGKPTNLKSLKRQLMLGARSLPLLRFIPGATRMFYWKIGAESGSLDADHRNLQMLTNILDIVSGEPHQFRHLSLLTGAKHYGMHLGPDLWPGYQVPFDDEGTTRCPGPNWYYEVEDHLRASAGPWSFSIFRPTFIIGYATGAPYNFGTGLAAYAALRKARQEPLTWFGDEASYQCTWEVSDARLIGQMMAWSTGEPAAHGEAFNVASGTPFRWKDLLPEVAAYFGMEAHVERDGLSVRRFLKDNEELWTELVQQHDLRPTALNQLITGDFLDRAMVMDWDVTMTTRKATAAGAPDPATPLKVFTSLFDRMRQDRWIP